MAIAEPRTTGRAPEPQRHWLVQWLTTTDHKRIGVLYLLNSFAFFFVAGLFALLMRTELAEPGRQLVTTNGYNQLFTLHGTRMIVCHERGGRVWCRRRTFLDAVLHW